MADVIFRHNAVLPFIENFSNQQYVHYADVRRRQTNNITTVKRPLNGFTTLWEKTGVLVTECAAATRYTYVR